MKRLSLDQVLKDNNTRDPNSISSLILTHRALSDVSCLGELKNLERLDLSANTLTSLEGLKSCANLKWLSVSQNKLQSLKGIEGLPKLTLSEEDISWIKKNLLRCTLTKITDKENVQSKIAEMNRDVSDTAAMLSDIHKGSLQSQYSFLFDSSQRSESTEASKVYQLQ